MTLEVIIRKESISVSYSYLLQTTVKADLPRIDGEYDFEGLSNALQEMKKDPVFAEKRDINLLPEAGVDYQTLVTVMDTVRRYPAVLITSVVDAELFPDISLGNAPDLKAAGEEATEATEAADAAPGEVGTPPRLGDESMPGQGAAPAMPAALAHS